MVGELDGSCMTLQGALNQQRSVHFLGNHCMSQRHPGPDLHIIEQQFIPRRVKTAQQCMSTL